MGSLVRLRRRIWRVRSGRGSRVTVTGVHGLESRATMVSLTVPDVGPEDVSDSGCASLVGTVTIVWSFSYRWTPDSREPVGGLCFTVPLRRASGTLFGDP